VENRTWKMKDARIEIERGVRQSRMEKEQCGLGHGEWRATAR
jgi:hypothetical protein